MFRGGDRIPERRIHDNNAAGRRCRDIDIIDADPGAADDFEGLGLLEDFRGHLGGRTNSKTFIIADSGRELFLVLAKRGLEIYRNAAILEDLHSRQRESVGNKYLGHCRPHAALVNAALVSAKAHSSQDVSVSMSLRSTVAPHQMRRPGGASR